jgi:hypothetical protein
MVKNEVKEDQNEGNEIKKEIIEEKDKSIINNRF